MGCRRYTLHQHSQWDEMRRSSRWALLSSQLVSMVAWTVAGTVEELVMAVAAMVTVVVVTADWAAGFDIPRQSRPRPCCNHTLRLHS